MTVRTGRQTVKFDRPFVLAAAGRTLPAGTYEIETEDEPVEGLAFSIYRRAATRMIVPAPAPSSATETIAVDPRDLSAALEQDGAATPGPAAADVR